MKLLSFIIFISIYNLCFFQDSAKAEISRLRISSNFGFGNSYAQSFGGSGKSYTEAPFGGSGTLEYYLTPFLDVGVEHIRSYGNNQTGFGLTGASFKYYFYNDHPQFIAGLFSGDSNELSNSSGYFRIKAWSPYVGIGGGFGQATIPSNNVMALNEYISFKGGIDYPNGNSWGFRSESNIAIGLAGSGKITLVNLIFGVYLFL